MGRRPWPRHTGQSASVLFTLFSITSLNPHHLVIAISNRSVIISYCMNFGLDKSRQILWNVMSVHGPMLTTYYYS